MGNLHGKDTMHTVDCACMHTYTPALRDCNIETHMVWQGFLGPTLASWVMGEHDFHLDTKNT